MSNEITDNIDESEVAKFEKIASVWWDTEGDFKPLHQINPLRLNYICDHSDGLFEKHVLDVGCGGGILSESMARSGAIVIGIDASQEPLNVAKLHSLESGIKLNYKLSLVEDYAANYAESFDVVTCMEMLEHVPDPESVVRSCLALVKPNGKVFFSTLNRNFKSWLLAIVAAENLLNWVPKGTHDHKKFIKPSEMMRWLDKLDVKVLDITGIHFNPISNAFYLSNDNVDVNYIVCVEKLSD